MPRNGSGTFTLATGNPVVSGTTIESSWANTTLSDIATEITNSLSRTGAGGMTGAFRAANGTSTVPGIAWGDETGTGFYRAGTSDTRLVVQTALLQKWTASGSEITGTFSASGATTVPALTATGNVSFDGGTFVFNDSGADKDARFEGDTDANLLFLDASVDRIGIGNGSPLSKVQVGTTGTTHRFLINTAVNNAGDIQLRRGSFIGFSNSLDTANSEYLFANAGNFEFGINGSTAMTLDSSGNLGLGVTQSAWASDRKALQVNLASLSGGNGNNFAVLGNNFYYDGTNSIYIATGAASSYAQNTSGAHIWNIAPSGTAGNTISFTQAMTLDASGKLALGATSVGSDFQMAINGGNGTTTGPLLVFQNSGTGTGNANGFIVGNFPLDAYVWNYENAAIIFGTNNTERARITSGGDLLVGQTATGYQNSLSVAIQGPSGYVLCNHVNGTGSGAVYAGFGYNGAGIGSITQDGTTAVLYNTTSDQRLKENIQDATSASDLIDAIQVRQFDWRSDGSHQRYGMVAQELVQVAPEAVYAPADPDDMMAVDYSKLVPMLIKEVQSLRARVAALEA